MLPRDNPNPSSGSEQTRGSVQASTALDRDGGYAFAVADNARQAQVARVSASLGIRERFRHDLKSVLVNHVAARAVSVSMKLGAEIHDVAVPVSSDRTVILAEAFAYHSRSIATNPELYLPETLSKLRLGATIDMATYMKAWLGLDHLRRTATKIFGDVDVLLTPTTPVPPPEIGELPSTFDEIMANDAVLWRNTRPFNLLAFPTISIPCGFTDAGMPIGLQLSGSPWQEGQLLQCAHAYEQVTNWHARRPTIASRRLWIDSNVSWDKLDPTRRFGAGRVVAANRSVGSN